MQDALILRGLIVAKVSLKTKGLYNTLIASKLEPDKIPRLISPKATIVFVSIITFFEADIATHIWRIKGPVFYQKHNLLCIPTVVFSSKDNTIFD